MDSMFTLGVILSAKDMLSPAMGKAGENVGKLATKIQAVSGKMAVMGTASYGMGRAMLSPVMDTLSAYKDLEKAQGDIASLGIGAKGIDTITKSAKEFSNQFAGVTANDFISASYDIKSGISSLSDEGVAKFTALSAMTGRATKSTAGEMTKLFALGYGIFKDSKETDFEFGERMSAQVSLAVQAFRTDGSDLTLGISNIGAQAQKMGVSLAEELAIIGNAKGAFNSASDAATGYRAFLDGAASAQDKLGLSFTDAEGKMLPMVNVLQQIKEKYGDDLGTLAAQKEIKDAFGSSEAVKIVNALVDKTDSLTASQKQLNNATMENVEIMAKSRNKGHEFDILNNKMTNLSTTIGSVFAPVAGKLATVIGDVVTSIETFTKEHETAATVIGYTVAGIGALLTVVGAVIIPISAIGMALPALVTGFGLASGAATFFGGIMSSVGRAMLMNPIGLAVTAIAGAAYLIYSNWEPISSFFKGLWNGVVSIFDGTISVIKDYFGWTPLGMLLNNWGVITTFFSGLWDGVVTIFSNTWSNIKASFGGVVEFIKAPFEAFFGWIAGKFEWVTNTIGPIIDKVSSIGDGISDTVGGIGDSIGDGLKTASNWFKFGDEKKSSAEESTPTQLKPANNKEYSVGKAVKNAAIGTALATQMAVAQPATAPTVIVPKAETQMAVAQPATAPTVIVPKAETQMAVAQPATAPTVIVPKAETQMAVAQPATAPTVIVPKAETQMAVAQPVNAQVKTSTPSVSPNNNYSITIQVQSGNPQEIAQEVKRVISQMEQSRKNRSYSDMEV